MRIDFEGKIYDPKAARKLSSRPGMDSHQELMQTQDGDYFLVVHRVLLNKPSPEPNGETQRFIRNEEIVPLTPMQALQWCLKSHIPKELHRYLPEYIRSNYCHL